MRSELGSSRKSTLKRSRSNIARFIAIRDDSHTHIGTREELG